MLIQIKIQHTMDNETRAALAAMEERMSRNFGQGALALHERIAALEVAADRLVKVIEKVLDRVEDTTRPWGRG